MIEGSTLIELVTTLAANEWVLLLAKSAGALAALAALLKIANSIRGLTDGRRARKLAEAISENAGILSFTREEVASSCKNYIRPNCTQIDPSDEEDLRNVVALAPLFESMDNHLKVGGEKRHVIILADSGMGKTSFCINYYAREKARGRKGQRVAIVPLGRSNALAQIGAIAEKRETILFLDAFDEDAYAIGREQERLVELMTAASDCKNIVITCRSQFFTSDDAIPRGSGIMYAAPRKAGQGREFPLHKLFLAPLTPPQIELYLARHFPYSRPRNWHRRSEAREMVRSIPELSVRPMLLELLPDLIKEKRRIDQLFGLYQFLIDKWLERERDWIEERDLLEISVAIAVRTFVEQRAGRGDRISGEELEKIASSFDSSIESWKIKSRSLLNRDIEGSFKFAHRSVMEFLFVCAALSGDDRCFEVQWTDLMKDLLVSFGNMEPPPLSVDIEALLGRDLSRTDIWPLATPLRLPRRVALSEAKKIVRSDAISTRHSRKIPVSWSNRRVGVHVTSRSASGSSYKVFDPTHGLNWHLVFITGQERDLFREKYLSPGLDAPITIDGYPWSRRLPSTDEMITLCETAIYSVGLNPETQLLHEDEIYWLGDSGDVGPFCCTIGFNPIERPYLQYVDRRDIGGGQSFHLYEFGNRYGHVGRQPFLAMAACIVHPEAESG